jgi:hypothetical protein
MTVEAKKQLFIVGSPRSGTTMLQILLASHPQVASTVEQTLFQHYVAPWLETWDSEVENIEKRGWKLGLPILWQREELEEILHQFLARAYAKILAGKPGATHIVDKHPGYSRHVALIKRFIPGARFIHIVRDGRDVAASMIAVHAKMGFAPSNVSAAATKWKTFVLAAREAAQFTNDYIEVHYEDFLRKGAEAYSQVLRFCELPVSDSWIAEVLEANSFEKMKERGASPDPRTPLSTKRYHRGVAGGWERDFTPRDRFVFEKIAGDLLRELGYAEAGWWARSSADRVIQPLREAWALRRPHLGRAFHSAVSAVLGRE